MRSARCAKVPTVEELSYAGRIYSNVDNRKRVMVKATKLANKVSNRIGLALGDDGYFPFMASIPEGMEYVANKIKYDRSDKYMSEAAYYMYLKYLIGAMSIYFRLKPYIIRKRFNICPEHHNMVISNLVSGGHVRIVNATKNSHGTVLYSYEINKDKWKDKLISVPLNVEITPIIKRIHAASEKASEKNKSKSEDMPIDMGRPLDFNISARKVRRVSDKSKLIKLENLEALNDTESINNARKLDEYNAGREKGKRMSRGMAYYLLNGTMDTKTIYVNYREYDAITNMTKSERETFKYMGEKIVEGADMPLGSFTLLIGSIAKQNELNYSMYTDIVDGKAIKEAKWLFDIMKRNSSPKENLCELLNIKSTKARSNNDRLKSFVRNYITQRENGTAYKKRGKELKYRFHDNELSMFIKSNTPNLYMAISRLQHRMWAHGHKTMYKWLEWLEYECMYSIMSVIDGFRVHDALYCRESDAAKAKELMYSRIFS